MLVLTIHWVGQNEYVRPVSATMKNYARKAIDAGADLVIGHHRHEVSGIEFYKGKYILYDLGNFVTGGSLHALFLRGADRLRRLRRLRRNHVER